MKKTALLIIIYFYLFLPLGSVQASDNDVPATPYGDYCRMYSHYGRNKIMLSQEYAEKALQHYYRKKGVDIKMLNRRGRFIKAHILKDNSIIDTILFDRHTGRIRSIY